MRALILLLLTIVGAQAATYPNVFASGANSLNASMLFSGTQYVTLGQPAGLTSVLIPGHEFTILLRRARAASNSTGVEIGQANQTNTTFSISSAGGSAETGNIGGVAFTTGSGSVKNATWNSIALVNHNVSGTFMGSVVLDGNSRSTEVAVGVQSAAGDDIMVGARRNASNADALGFFSGNIGAIAVWNYALTDDQIHSAMGLLCPSEVIYTTFNGTNFGTGLIAYWTGSENSGTTMHDCVTGYDGTVNTSGVFSTAAFSHYPMQFWGDSLTVGAGSQTNQPYGDQVVAGGSGTRNMRSVQINGYSGQNCSFIESQMALTQWKPFLTWTQVYWVGAHDFGSTSNVTNFVTTETALLPHNRWLFIGQTPNGVGTNGGGNPNSAGSQDWGTTGTLGRGSVDGMNYATYALCGGRWIGSQVPTVSLANLPTEANDALQLRMPASVVSAAGPPHPFDSDYILISQTVDIRARLLNPMW